MRAKIKIPLRIRTVYSLQGNSVQFSQIEAYNYEIYPIQTMDMGALTEIQIIQSYNMFTVLKYAINEILCVSV